MEQHPVPQNVTTFQFRLIGDMTIKQFGYLAGGVILAYISYKLPLPFFFTWPLTVIFGLGGFGFAFVPIEERPMDIWVLSFLKNVYNPTIFHWERTEAVIGPALPSTIPVPAAVAVPTPLQQTGVLLTPAQTLTTPGSSPQSGNRTTLQQLFTPSSATSTQTTKKGRGNGLFSWLSTVFFGTPKTPMTMAQNRTGAIPLRTTPVMVSQVQPQHPASDETFNGEQADKEKRTVAELSALKLQLDALQKELEGKTVVESRVFELQKQLSALSAGREAMEKELMMLRQKQHPMTQFAPQKQTGTVVTRPGNEPTIKTMDTGVAIRAGLPRLTTFPNVVTGIIKDYDNNLLPGVLVTVKDKEDIPLRALKTNKLGQFAASTQLPNGTFFVEVEDPRGRFTFDRVQITLNGSIMPALQVIAKSKRQLDRETLQKQIFGAPNANS